jgi:hypothetical protein
LGSDVPVGTEPELSAAASSSASSAEEKVRVRLVALTEATPADVAASLPEGLTQVVSGQPFVLEVWVQDGFAPAVGITGGHVDISYSRDVAALGKGDHGQVFSTLSSGIVNTDLGLVDDFGGATFLPGQGQAPKWARFGSFLVQTIASGPIVFDVSPGKLQFSRFGLGNVAWDDVCLDRLVLNRLAGDVDGSGTVEFADFVILANNFGREDAAVSDGDLDGDGDVDFSDFVLLADNFGAGHTVG